MTPCWPSWHARYSGLSTRTVASGCSTSGGNVQCDPAEMAAKAGVPLAVYTLARYMTSEVGSGTVEEKVAVGEAAYNRSKGDVNALLLYRQNSGHPNYGKYGPIHGGTTATAPYGRWAATSKDPTVETLALAEFVMSGASNFSGADDQNGPQYFENPETKIKSQAASGNYWVGPLVGVDPWHTFLYRHYGFSPSTPAGALLLERGLAFARARKRVGTKWAADPAISWSGLPVCSPWTEMSGGAIVGIVLVGSAVLGAAFVGFKNYFEKA